MKQVLFNWTPHPPNIYISGSLHVVRTFVHKMVPDSNSKLVRCPIGSWRTSLKCIKCVFSVPFCT